MASSVTQSGAPSRERIYQLAQEVVHGSIDPTVATDDLMGVVREEAIRVCPFILANIFPPHIRQVLVDETHGGGGCVTSDDRRADADETIEGGTGSRTGGGTGDGPTVVR